VKSNLGKPGLTKHRVVHLTDEIALAEIGSGVGVEYPFQPEEPSSCYAPMENALERRSVYGLRADRRRKPEVIRLLPHLLQPRRKPETVLNCFAT
jgi:hypothetical protein